MRPDFSFERNLIEQHGQICGIDEAGRGPLAGPVIAAAVIFRDLEIANDLAGNITDSKLIKAPKRALLAQRIYETAYVAVGEASVEEIDSINILQASLLAMRRAMENLSLKPGFALIDGNKVPPGLCVPCQPIVKGDLKSLSVAAASIIAKTHRDKIMSNLHGAFPAYGWEKNAGYGTKAHLEALKNHGATPHHRRSFAPISELLSITN